MPLRSSRATPRPVPLARFTICLLITWFRVCGEAALFAREPLESALRRFVAFLLNLGSQPQMPVSNVADMGAGVVVSVRIRGYVFDAKVYAQKLRDLAWRRMIHFTTRCQIELVAAKDQIALALLGLEHLLLSLSRYKRNLETANERPDGHVGFLNVPAENALIVCNRAVFSEPRRFHPREGLFLLPSLSRCLLRFLVSAVRIRNSLNAVV
jgi:hypothetical protein